ncbi:MAG: sulfur carrier protein ThiS [Pseudomonadota bacterium]|jgi:sulfur carrier protein|nr:sulfur carrier protein ThiS [Gammaproteobacteria bacterium]MEC8848197.1 sulfur carrier protein ThiS [Pseudomonadota bacterium]|tara:strand:+ start:357 stop:548 length:192 start_codon:yes stop_codon:yes gene_type:complete
MTVNGQPHPGTPPTVAALIDELALVGRRIAVSVNGAVVPRSTWPAQALAPGDQVEIVHAVGGG